MSLEFLHFGEDLCSTWWPDTMNLSYVGWGDETQAEDMKTRLVASSPELMLPPRKQLKRKNSEPSVSIFDQK